MFVFSLRSAKPVNVCFLTNSVCWGINRHRSWWRSLHREEGRISQKIAVFRFLFLLKVFQFLLDTRSSLSLHISISFSICSIVVLWTVRSWLKNSVTASQSCQVDISATRQNFDLSSVFVTDEMIKVGTLSSQCETGFDMFLPADSKPWQRLAILHLSIVCDVIGCGGWGDVKGFLNLRTCSMLIYISLAKTEGPHSTTLATVVQEFNVPRRRQG